MLKLSTITVSSDESIKLGEKIASLLNGGEVIELASDVGGGKTTLTKGIALGIGIESPVTSPTFTVSKVYNGSGLTLHHYDLYRLDDLGIMKEEIAEVVSDKDSIAVIEWAGLAEADLPKDKLIKIELYLIAENEEHRRVVLSLPDDYADWNNELELEVC
jgi:tRNA threonylcarbamoyladenosine biosynthesis protein TsaE